MKTQQQRQQEKRKEKLDLIDQQIKEGTLKVRKMTAAERKKYPAKSPGETRRRRGRARR
jgi:hypothetical protein